MRTIAGIVLFGAGLGALVVLIPLVNACDEGRLDTPSRLLPFLLLASASPSDRHSSTTLPVRTDSSAAMTMRRLFTPSFMWSVRSVSHSIAFNR